MYKDYELTVAAGTTEASPTEFIKPFPACMIEQVTITFPKGPNREVYTRILHEAENVIPIDPEEWINGEDESVVIVTNWQNWDNLYRLRIQMCSPGARLSHKVIYRFDLGEMRSSNPLRDAVDGLVGKFLPIP